MSLDRERKPVEVRMWNGESKWVKVTRYTIHKGRSDGWLTFRDSDGDERMAAPGNWRQVKT